MYHSNKTAWKWIPTTFFMEGLPFTMIVVVSTIMYKNFGLSNSEITFYTGWLYIPWVIKPVWAWFVDVYRTKRWWIYGMQMCLAITFVAITFSLQTPYYFKLSIILFWLCALFSSSHDIAADGFYLISLSSGQQSLFVGMQSLFYQVAKFFGSGLLVLISGFLLSKTNNNAKLSWSIIMLIVALLIFAISVYHQKTLPRDEKTSEKTISQGFNEIKHVFSEFFKLKGLWVTLIFVMTFRLGDNQVNKIVPLFLLDDRTHGGLGFDNTYVGFANMFVLAAMITAGVLGGVTISKFGLKKCMWYMLAFVNLPHAVYIYLAYARPESQIVVLCLQVMEHFSTTFSLTAYTMITFHLVKDSAYKTAHYAFISGIMVAGVMLPSMFSGAIQQALGYQHFFIYVMFTMIPSMLIMPFIKITDAYGKRLPLEKK